jgi:hypothetical protein
MIARRRERHWSNMLRIVQARGLAMRGEIQRAHRLLSEKVPDETCDRIACAMTHAEILHLDQRTAEALSMFGESVIPYQNHLPEEIVQVISRNRIETAFGTGFPEKEDFDRHLAEIDRRKLLRLEILDGSALLTAAEAAQEGKNYISEPIYASTLNRAYRQFDWLALRLAAVHMCQEHLRLKQFEEAAFCAVLAQSQKSVESIADALRSGNEAYTVVKVIKKLHEICHLKRHIAIAAEFICKLGDAIPDSQVANWIDFLHPYRTLHPQTWSERSLLNAARNATTALLDGADPSQSDIVIENFITHADWAATDAARLELLKPLLKAASRASEAGSQMLVEALCALVTSDPPGCGRSESGRDFVSDCRAISNIEGLDIREDAGRKGSSLFAYGASCKPSESRKQIGSTRQKFGFCFGSASSAGRAPIQHPAVVPTQVVELLTDALGDSDARVRSEAYHATHILGSLVPDCLSAVVRGTSDPDNAAASTALQICGLQAAAIVSEKLLPITLAAIKIQHRHSDPNIRFGAASASARLLKEQTVCANEKAKSLLDSVLARLNVDVSRRVRRAALDES